jgi:predicted metal-binding membrane protein
VSGLDIKETTIERALNRDRVIVFVALVFVLLISWMYVLSGAGMDMSAFKMSSVDMALGRLEPRQMDISDKTGAMSNAMSRMAMPVAWTLDYGLLMFFMWWIMMIAMMLPSAAPMILLHAKITRSSAAGANMSDTPWSTASFTLGYLLCWAAFSVVAVALQRTFESLGILSPTMLNSTNALFAGGILVLAGLYQMTPLKKACLEHCRSPIAFLSQNWRDGSGGALVLGLRHGVYCLGCCWGLMAILFFGGIMNLYWIIGLAMIVFLEKLLPVGPRLGQITGALLLAWGATFLYSALV